MAFEQMWVRGFLLFYLMAILEILEITLIRGDDVIGTSPAAADICSEASVSLHSVHRLMMVPRTRRKTCAISCLVIGFLRNSLIPAFCTIFSIVSSM